MELGREELITRWWTPAMDSARADVELAMSGEKNFGELSLRTPDGLADLRGYQFPDPPGLLELPLTPPVVAQLAGHVQVRDTAINRVDFSHAAMRLWEMTNVGLSDCRFLATDLMGLRLWQCDLTDCDFTTANIRDARLGGFVDGRPNIWTRCNLTHAHLPRTDFSEGDFHDVTFDDARLDDATFRRVTLTGCSFAGLLSGVRLDGSAPEPDQTDVQSEWWLEDLDLRGCTFQDCTIHDYSLESVHLPETVDGLVPGLSITGQQDAGKPPTGRAVEGRFVTAHLPHPDELEAALRAQVDAGSDLTEFDGCLLVSEDRDFVLLARREDGRAVVLSQSEFDHDIWFLTVAPPCPQWWRDTLPDHLHDLEVPGLFGYQPGIGWTRPAEGADGENVWSFLRLDPPDELYLPDEPDHDGADIEPAQLADADDADDGRTDDLAGSAADLAQGTAPEPESTQRAHPSDQSRAADGEPTGDDSAAGAATPSGGTTSQAPRNAYPAWLLRLPNPPRGRWAKNVLTMLLLVALTAPPAILTSLASQQWHLAVKVLSYAVMVVLAVIVVVWVHTPRPERDD